MADVAVETAAYTGFYVHPVRCGPVWTDQNIGYVFFTDTAQQLRYRKTTDGGATWAASVLVSAGEANDWVLSIDVWFDKWTPGDSGTKIHIWWCEALTDLVHYRSLDTSGDSLGTDRTVFTGVSFTTGGRTVSLISGTKAVGGNLYVQFWGDTDEHGFARSVDSGDNWTARTDGADGDGADEIICLPDADSADNQDIVMIYWDRTANEVSIKKYDDSGNSWSETAIGGAVATSAILQIGAVVRHSDGHIIVAYWNGFDVALADLKVWDIALATPTITAKADVVTDSDDCVGVGLFIDQNTDDLYCAYLGNEDGSETWQGALTAFYKKSTDGGATWGAQTAYQQGAADDARYIGSGQSTPGAASGRFEPMWFNDDLDDLFVNKVNSVELLVATAFERIIGLAYNLATDTLYIGTEATTTTRVLALDSASAILAADVGNQTLRNLTLNLGDQFNERIGHMGLALL